MKFLKTNDGRVSAASIDCIARPAKRADGTCEPRQVIHWHSGGEHFASEASVFDVLNFLEEIEE